MVNLLLLGTSDMMRLMCFYEELFRLQPIIARA